MKNWVPRAVSPAPDKKADNRAKIPTPPPLFDEEEKFRRGACSGDVSKGESIAGEDQRRVLSEDLPEGIESLTTYLKRSHSGFRH